MPHRSAALAERCDSQTSGLDSLRPYSASRTGVGLDSCDRIAVSRCLCCDRPACEEHAADDRRCQPCESELALWLAGIKPVKLKAGARSFGQMTAASALIGGAFFGLFALIGVLFTGNFSLAALGVVLIVAALAGILSVATFAALSLPFVGGVGTVAGSRAFRRFWQRRRFHKERPGQRQRPAAADIDIDIDEVDG